MTTRRTAPSLLVLSSLAFATVLAADFAPASAGAYGSVPLAFEENRGQTDESVTFLARGGGYGIFLAEAELVFVLRDRSSGDAASAPGASIVRLQFVGAQRDALAEGVARLPGTSHYFTGSDPTLWREDVPQFEKVRVSDIYPGIDLLLYGNQRQLEYDFIVHPGADLGQIRLRAVGGAAKLESASGDLVVETPRGALRQRAPDTFEEYPVGSNGPRRKIDSHYRMDADGDIRFIVAEHRSDRTIVIDPVVLYSTYHGGASEDAGFGIAADTSGNAYVAGYTASLNFPVQTPHQAVNASNYTTDFFDAFVSKFNSAGSALLYSTYFGGLRNDHGIAIAIDAANNAYVTGRTTSINFPVTAGAYQMANGGASGTEDAFIFKLNPTGGLVYSTYIGGTDSDRGEGIAVDAAGNAYISGGTASLATFPSTAILGPAGANDGFVFKLNPAGTARVYGLRIGGSLNDTTEAINLDLAGNAYVAGHTSSTDFPLVAAVQAVKSGGIDATFYKVNAAGTALLYSTFLGGSGDDLSLGLQTDGAGNAYYTGKTNSPLVAATAQFPTSPGVFQSVNAGPPGSNDVFITKLTPAGAIAYSTLVGSARDDIGYGIGVDSNGNATFAGETNAATGLEADVFISKLNSTGTVQVYGIIFRGPANDFGRDLDFDVAGNAYVTGFSESATPLVMFPSPPPGSLPFPALQPNNAGGADAIVIKFTDSVDLQVTKTDGQLTDTPGTSLTYTIVVTNPGPAGATGATVTDNFPAELSNVAWTAVLAGGATGATAGSGNISETVAIPVGGSITYTVTADISPSATGTLTNTVTVAPEAIVVDANPANNTATDTTLLVPVGDLAITKTDGLAAATPGSAHQYTIVVTNNGPNAIVGATVTDTFPAAFTGVTFTATQTGGASGFTPAGAGSINDTVTMPAGSTITYIANGIISPAATGVLTNTATVAGPAGTSDPNPGNNSATDNTTLSPAADLSITKTDGVTTATPGGSVTYTIVVTNPGPSNVVGATVSDTFPATITATYTATGAAGTSGYTPAGSGNINDTVTMPAGSTITYIVTANISPAATGTLTNTGTVTAPAGVSDGNPANNSSTDTDTLEPQVDLAITKTDGVTTATPGGSVTYTIVATNSGPSDVVGASIVDNFAPTLTVTWTATGTAGATGFTPAGSGNINDTVNLAAGSSITYTVSAAISSAATGTLSNTATITAPAGTTDTDPANNSATDIDALGAEADLSITKTDGVTTVNAGDPLTYTIVVSNPGPSDAVGATIADIFPAAYGSVTYTSTATGGATGNTASGSGNIADTVNFPAGSSITYIVTGTVDPAATGTLSNTATVSAPAGVTDPVPGNNSATDTDTIGVSADLAITKSDGQTTAVAGAPLTYTIVVTNSGPSSAAGATVTDIFPPELTAITYTASSTGGATGFTPAGSGNINDTVSMPAGSTITYVVSTTLSPGATGTVSNTATVAAAAGTTDPDPANNSATDTDTIGSESDLAITKTDGQTNAIPGQTITYTIVVSSSGPSTVVGATVTDLFPAELVGVTYTSIATGGATGNTAAGAGNINDLVNLPAGSSITYTATGTLSPSATGTLSNTATVTAPAGITDPEPANNSATDTDTVAAEADLSVTKSDSPDPVDPNATITYAIGVANAGPSDAVAVTLTDILPAGTTFASLVQNSGPVFSCVTPAPSTTGTVTCTIAALGIGTTADFTLVVNVDGGAAGSILSNTATIASATADDNPANDSATATTTVIGGPDVFAMKSVTSDSQFETGTEVTYTIVLTNAGGSTQGDNPGDEFTDILPIGVDLVSASADSGNATVDLLTNTVHWNGALLPNQSVTVTVTAIITATSGEVSNQGTVYYDADLDGVNESSRPSDDAIFPGASDPTVFTIGGGSSIVEIPTLSQFALAFLALMLVGAALVVLRRN